MKLLEHIRNAFWPAYRVSLQGRAGISYREGARQMIIDSELLSGGEFDIVVYTTSINQWLPPHQADRLTDEDKQRVIKNVAYALRRGRIEWA